MYDYCNKKNGMAKETNEQIGIFSWTYKCDNIIQVYTCVGLSSDWIQRNI